MKNKGFTLIELLAVIVILAIIALIATPIVLGIIEDSKNNANRISAEYMMDSVEKAYSMAYTGNMGAKPKKEDIKKHFDMKGAEWITEGGKDYVRTTDRGVVCEIKVSEDGRSLSVVCPAFDEKNSNMVSETMDIAVSTGTSESAS